MWAVAAVRRSFTAKGESNYGGLTEAPVTHLGRHHQPHPSSQRRQALRRADLYRQEGRFEEAAELVAQGLRLSPNNGVGHLLSAYLHLAFRQIGPAKSEFQSVSPGRSVSSAGAARSRQDRPRGAGFGACRPFLDKALQSTRISGSASSPGDGGRLGPRPREAQAKRPMQAPRSRSRSSSHRRRGASSCSPKPTVRWSSRTETRTPWTWPRT